MTMATRSSTKPGGTWTEVAVGAEEHGGQDQLVTGADDHRGGGLDADALGDAAEILLGAQVAGQLRPQPRPVSDGAGHAGEPGEDLGPAEQAREGGQDRGVQGQPWVR